MKTGASWRSVIYAGWLLCCSEPPRKSGKVSSTAFLVYVAAILLYKPIFTQPLGFVLCAAGAVEKSATERAVSVVYSRDSIDISKINAAFLTGQQIDRIHVQQLLFTFVHVPRGTTFAIVPCTVPKDHCFFDQRYAQKFSTLKLPE